MRGLTWDCDDIAIIDRECLRVGLGWLPPTELNQPWYLVVAVGPTPLGQSQSLTMESLEYLSDRIIERTSKHLPPDAVMTGDAGQPVGAELIDTVLDLLRQTTNTTFSDGYKSNSPADHNPIETPSERPDKSAVFAPLNDMPFISDPAFVDAMAQPDAVTLEGPAAKPAMARPVTTTQPMRLSIHTLAITLMLQVPALGAFLFVYTMLRDINTIAT